MKNKRLTSKSFSKRFKKTNSTILRKSANKGHLLRKKDSRRKRRLSRKVNVTRSQFLTISSLI